ALPILSGLFWVTAAMALLGMLIMAVWIPKPDRHVHHMDAALNGAAFVEVLKNTQLLRLNLGIFSLHALLMASFMALPLALIEHGALARDEHWWVYLLAMGLGFVAMVPFIIYSEKKRRL